MKEEILDFYRDAFASGEVVSESYQRVEQAKIMMIDDMLTLEAGDINGYYEDRE